MSPRGCPARGTRTPPPPPSPLPRRTHAPGAQGPRLSASAAGAGGDARSAEGARDAPPGKHRRLDRGAPEPQPPDRPTQPRTEPPPAAAAPSGDQGCWGAPPGPAEDGLAGGQRPGAPRHSPSGDAPHDPRAGPASDETPGPARPKPVSPVATSGPLRAPGGLPLPKDSKIPISVKHLASLPSSHPAAPQQPARSEVPRTKIPVSKVLVRRVSNRGLAGTSLRAAACHDSAKKL
ncbi:APC membrane recruitment protein 2 [Vulpes lagopus]